MFTLTSIFAEIPILVITSFVVLVVLCLASALWYKRKKDSRNQNGELVVGLYAEYRPFEFVNERGEVTGYDVDLARELAKRLKKRLHIKNIGFDSLISALQQREIDILLSGVSITPERLQRMDMIPYHGKPLRSFALIFWRYIPEGVLVIDDLRKVKNKKIAVQVGTIQEEFLTKYKFFDVKPSCSITGLLLDIRHGQAIAGILQSGMAYRLQSEYPKVKIMEVPLQEKDWVLGDGIGIRRGNKILHDQIEKTVAKLKENGVSARIHTKWFGERCCNN